MDYADSMPQVATYWPPGDPDGFGGVVLGPPRPVMCRWQNEQKLFRDKQGQDLMSNAIVYVGEALETTGWLALGEFPDGDPQELEDAWEIRQTSATPSLDGDLTLHKVWL